LNTDDFPVDSLTWDEAVLFCNKLSALPAEKAARRFYRLPTEAEWEYACRAGAKTHTPFSFGKSLSSRQANFDGTQPYGDAERGPSLGRTAKVGSYKPNAWGLYDMHGNVWQWCSDWYARDYYTNCPRTDPPGPEKGTRRVSRGGAWYNPARYVRTGERNSNVPSTRNLGYGFRIVAASSPPIR
jgi:formylglycine-generating enzyme required for sulfatase activity